MSLAQQFCDRCGTAHSLFASCTDGVKACLPQKPPPFPNASEQEKTEPSVTVSASTEDTPAEVKFVRHEPTTSQTILQQAQEIIAGRHERYGDCTEVFAATNEMFAIYRGLKKGETSAHDTAVFNIIQKLVRIGSGQNHQDNWIDIAGYAATGGEVSNDQI